MRPDNWMTLDGVGGRPAGSATTGSDRRRRLLRAAPAAPAVRNVPTAVLILSHTSGRGSTDPTIWFSDAELVLPRRDHRREVLVDGHHGLDLRALVGIEGAERIFRGERDMVFAIGHH